MVSTHHPRSRSVLMGVATRLTAGAAVAGLTALGVAGQVVRRITAPGSSLYYQYHTYTPWELSIPAEDVSIPGPLGRLPAWLLPAPDPAAPTIIALHGHGGCKSDLLGIGKALWQRGFNCLVFDYHGAGLADGSGSTLGYRETADALAVIQWVAEHLPGSPIGLIGFSMGGAVAILAAARDERARAVVTDCAFASQREVVAHNIRRHLHVPATPFIQVADVLLASRRHFRFSDVEPRAEIGRIAPRPLLLIHAGADAVVPVHHAWELYEAAGEPKEIWIVDGVPHCGAYFHDRPSYCERVGRFFADALGVAGGLEAPLAADLDERDGSNAA
ncbi:MAG: alpha/beta fold hydrolase [Thermomicrobiaceae bacterium]|nr:alpha/beta fold hydrolase [Thermomicrobiaceae bacterium]